MATQQILRKLFATGEELRNTGRKFNICAIDGDFLEIIEAKLLERGLKVKMYGITTEREGTFHTATASFRWVDVGTGERAELGRMRGSARTKALAVKRAKWSILIKTFELEDGGDDGFFTLCYE